MLGKVAPAVPLKPANRYAIYLDDVDVNWLGAINAGTIVSLKTGQIERVVPPGGYVRSCEPSLQKREVRAGQRTKRQGTKWNWRIVFR